VVWQTGAGGAGVSVFYSNGTDDATAALGTFFNAIKALFPAAVSWQIPSSGDKIEATTGALTGSWSGGTGATIASTGSGTYAAGGGAYVRWYTNTIRDGRKFYGRTFLAPILASVYDNDGTLTGGNVTTMQNAANALVTAAKTVIWGRPTTPGGSDGLFAGVTSALVPDKVTSLKSRRS
jgi:hypothetical protein